MQEFINFIQREYIFLIINGLIFTAVYIFAYALGKNANKRGEILPQKNQPPANAEQQAAAEKKLHESSEQLRLILADFWHQLKNQQWQAAKERRNLLSHFLPTVFCREVGRQLHGLNDPAQELWLNNALCALKILNSEHLNQLLSTNPIQLTINELSGLMAIAKKFGKQTEMANYTNP